ncbi:nuclear transport factor 2 family protein [Rhabdobacter roseus]|uniref:Nuclear transport factor 2 family protein n=1 Tax=Rhabdobacter roseus TaxID=1655419 RepID=A0A840TKV6_9BACT|nr:nuclear transport factor 2 family protein [Rhabdobacter roseus]MBB5284816.1 hypothetical protein [Rhabdobacter roseus]
MKASLWLFPWFLVCWLAGSTHAQAQNEEQAVREVVKSLFDGMRSGDSSVVRQAFLPDASLQSIVFTKEGTTKVQKEAIPNFVKAVGTPHDKVWDEQIYDLKVLLDGPMAVVWVPYKFYLGGQFSHCGVNAFTLARVGTTWKIAGITDTRRRDNCL